MEIELRGIVAEVRTDFERYEGVLGANDVVTFNSMFHKDSRVIRSGGNENPYGYYQIEGFVLRTRQPDLRARYQRPSSALTAATMPSPRHRFIARACPERSAVRCRPGFVFPKGGASSRHM